jgi:hypothetical protein
MREQHFQESLKQQKPWDLPRITESKNDNLCENMSKMLLFCFCFISICIDIILLWYIFKQDLLSKFIEEDI